MKDISLQDRQPQPGYAPDGPEPASGPSLTFSIAAYLTLALLPLGLIAVLQSLATIDAARDNYRASLAAQTARVAAPEGEAIVRAFGIARGLVYAVPALLEDPERCANTMRRTASEHPRIGFAGFVDADQVTSCNSSGETYDFSDVLESDRVFASEEMDVTFNPAGAATGEAVVIVSAPVPDEATGEFIGFVSLSFPTRPLAEAREAAGLDDAVTLVTFDGRGRILMSDVARDEVATLLPEGLALADLGGGQQRVFAARSADGVRRTYALAPMVPGHAYALGVWDAPDRFTVASGLAVSSVSFPLLMWLVSLGVAVWALRRLVITPVRRLGLRMRAFADRRTMFQANALVEAPRELSQIGASFELMANKIVQDEAQMEDRIHEREVLLREVHHRVKNNLQLMSSIINMQVRASTSREADEALRRVQGRLASLAKFHQDLYETSSLSRLRADQLLEDLARQMVALGTAPARRVDLRLDLGETVLSPDQASPLAMLVTEALTNALKHAGADEGGAVTVDLSMKTVPGPEGETVVVEIANSLAAGTPDEAEEADGAEGLGARLIRAFASQLEGALQTDVSPERYVVRLTFAKAARAAA